MESRVQLPEPPKQELPREEDPVEGWSPGGERIPCGRWEGTLAPVVSGLFKSHVHLVARVHSPICTFAGIVHRPRNRVISTSCDTMEAEVER